MKSKIEILEQIYNDQMGQIQAAEVNIRLYTQDNLIQKDVKLGQQIELKIRSLKVGKERAERSLKIIAEMIEEEKKKAAELN